jgi:hypothetical protein
MVYGVMVTQLGTVVQGSSPETNESPQFERFFCIFLKYKQSNVKFLVRFSTY